MRVYDGDTTIVGMIEPKETIIEKYFKSENTNGNFSIFHRDGDEFVALSYEPYNEIANPNKEKPKYATPFGVFAKDILAGKTTPNDYVIKFEVFVSKDAPMKGDALTIGFFKSVPDDDYSHWNSRAYCSCWQPSKITYDIKENGEWNYYSFSCDAWSCEDWMTVTIPMEDLLYDFTAGNYIACAQTERKCIDQPVEYRLFGDDENGLPYFEKNNDYKELFDGDSPSDLVKQSITGLAIVQVYYDQPIYDKGNRHPYIAVDNVRIVPKDNNGGVWPLIKYGVPTRDFYTAPVYNCK